MSGPQDLLVALASVPAPGEWASMGRCRKAPSELFFPGRGEDSSAAKGICEGCPVVGDCRSYAMEHAGLKGVWGGMSESERRLERRLGRRQSPATSEPAAAKEVAAAGSLYRQLQRLVEHPGAWARVVRYRSKTSAKGVASALRGGAGRIPAGNWDFEGRLNQVGGSDLYARFVSADPAVREAS